MSTASIFKLVTGLFFGALALIYTVGAFFSSTEVLNPSQRPSQWSTPRLEIIQMLRDGRYAALTEKYAALHEKFASDQASWQEVSRAVYAFDFADPTLKEKFSEWVEKFPDSFVPYLARGHYLSKLGFEYRGTSYANRVHPEQMKLMLEHFRVAMPDLRKAIKLNSNAVSAYARVMDIQMFTGDYWGVWQTYLVGYFNVPDGRQLTKVMNTALEPKWGGSDFARSMFKKFALVAVLFDPGFRVVLDDDSYAAANQATYAKQYGKALELWTNLMATDKSAYVRYRRAMVLRKLKRKDEALRDALISIEKSPEYVEGLNLVASLHTYRKEPEKAVTYYSASLEQAPYDPDVLINRAYALSRINRYDEARLDLEKALVFGNWSAHVHFNRARLLRSPLKLAAEAKKAYVRYFEFGSNKPADWYEFTFLLFETQDCDYYHYTHRILDKCLRDSSCGRDRVEREKAMAEMNSWTSHCQPVPDFSRYDDFFPAYSYLEDIALAGLKPGEGKKEILAAFPDAIIKPIFTPEFEKPVAYLAEWGSWHHPPRLMAYMNNEQKIFSIGYTEDVPDTGDYSEIEKKYIGMYGQPDTRRVQDGLTLEYLQSAGKGRYAKTLTIKIKPYEAKEPVDDSGSLRRIRIITIFLDQELSEKTTAPANNDKSVQTEKPSSR